MEKKYHRGPSFLNSINYKLYWVLNIPFSQNLTNFLKFLSLISFFSSSILEVLVQMFCVPLQQNALIVFFVNLNYLVHLFLLQTYIVPKFVRRGKEWNIAKYKQAWMLCLETCVGARGLRIRVHLTRIQVRFGEKSRFGSNLILTNKIHS